MRHRSLLRPLLIGVSLAALVFLGYERGVLDVPELRSLDARFRLRGAITPRLPIVIVSIDQDSFDELGLPWPWPRTLHAELIHKLAANEARLIAFDILFTEPKPDPREDPALAEAIQSAGNVILAAEYTEVSGAFGPKMSMNLPTPLIREHALSYGPVNLIPDRDGVVRSALLGLSFQDRVFPAFAYQIYQALDGEATLEKNMADKPPSSPVLYYINFRGPARTYPHIPYYRILQDEVTPASFRDKIVLVGASAASLHDLHPTPYSANRPTSGVEIQANFVETLIANDPLLPLPAWSHGVLFLVLSAATIGVTLSIRPWRAFLLVITLISLLAITTLYLFVHFQIWIPLVPALLGIVITYGGMTLDHHIREQRERLRLRVLFSKYVSPDVMNEILDNRAGLGLGGRRRHITVLFSDIRDFTSISERIEPEQVVACLSEYLAAATQIVFKHGGTVDKFIGDAVMAMFGAPKSYGDDAVRAVMAGRELIQLVDALAPKWLAILGCPLKVGVGISSGEAVVGSIGSEIRADFTAIGDTVNLASRLEGLTKELGIPLLISEYTAAELGDKLTLRPLQRVKVAGREAPLLIYTVEEVCDGTVISAARTPETPI
jgi:adenylate cyclase